MSNESVESSVATSNATSNVTNVATFDLNVQCSNLNNEVDASSIATVSGDACGQRLNSTVEVSATPSTSANLEIRPVTQDEDVAEPAKGGTPPSFQDTIKKVHVVRKPDPTSGAQCSEPELGANLQHSKDDPTAFLQKTPFLEDLIAPIGNRESQCFATKFPKPKNPLVNDFVGNPILDTKDQLRDLTMKLDHNYMPDYEAEFLNEATDLAKQRGREKMTKKGKKKKKKSAPLSSASTQCSTSTSKPSAHRTVGHKSNKKSPVKPRRRVIKPRKVFLFNEQVPGNACATVKDDLPFPPEGEVPDFVPFKDGTGIVGNITIPFLGSTAAHCAAGEDDNSAKMSDIPFAKGEDDIIRLHSGAGNFCMVAVNINGIPCTALLDTGSSHTLISKEVADKANLRFTPVKMAVKTCNGTDSDAVHGIARARLTFPQCRSGLILETNTLILQDPNGYDAIIGQDLLRTEKVDFQLDRYEWHFAYRSKGKRVEKHSIPLLWKRHDEDKALNARSTALVYVEPHVRDDAITVTTDDPTLKVGDWITVHHQNNPEYPGLIFEETLDSVRVSDTGLKYFHVKISNESEKLVVLNQTEPIVQYSLIDTDRETKVSVNTFNKCLYEQDYAFNPSDSTRISNNVFVENSAALPSDEPTDFFDEIVNSLHKHKSNKKLHKKLKGSHQRNTTDVQGGTKTVQQNLEQLRTAHPNIVLPDMFAEADLLRGQQAELCDSEKMKQDKQNMSSRTVKLDHLGRDAERFSTLFAEHPDVWSTHSEDCGVTNLMEHHIEVSKLPNPQKQRFLDQGKQQFASTMVDKYVQAGIISLNNRPDYCSNLVLVPKFPSSTRESTKAAQLNAKKQGRVCTEFRVVQDLREINALTVNVYRCTPPTPDFILGKLSNHIVSSVDITHAFFTIPLSEESKHLTSFYLGNKIYMWQRMTQGLISAPHSFQLLMNLTFDDDYLKVIKKQYIPGQFQHLIPDSFSDFVFNYYDDIYLRSKTLDEHIWRWKTVLLALERAGLKLNPAKCNIATSTHTVLGLAINTAQTELALDMKKASGIMHWDRPSSLYELQSRLYSLGYFSRFLPKLKEILFPLLELLRGNVFIWNQVHEDAWTRMKTLVMADLRLTMPLPEEKLYLFTDASKVSCSQILFVERNERLKVVGCNSRIWSYADSLKSPYLKEAISLTVGLQHFHSYIMNSHEDLVVFTDAKSLIYNSRAKSYNVAASNVSQFLANYALQKNYSVFHISGEHNVLADTLSRAFASSRFLSKQEHSISKEHVDHIPPIPDPFCVNSDDLYEFLIAEVNPESNDIGSRARKLTPTPRPLKALLKAFKDVTPEEKYASAIRLLEQWNDPALATLAAAQPKLENPRNKIDSKVASTRVVEDDFFAHYAQDFPGAVHSNSVHIPQPVNQPCGEENPPHPLNPLLTQGCHQILSSQDLKQNIFFSQYLDFLRTFEDPSPKLFLPLSEHFQNQFILNPTALTLRPMEEVKLDIDEKIFANFPFDIKKCREEIEVQAVPLEGHATKTSIWIRNVSMHQVTLEPEEPVAEFTADPEFCILSYTPEEEFLFTPVSGYIANVPVKVSFFNSKMYSGDNFEKIFAGRGNLTSEQLGNKQFVLKHLHEIVSDVIVPDQTHHLGLACKEMSLVNSITREVFAEIQQQDDKMKALIEGVKSGTLDSYEYIDSILYKTRKTETGFVRQLAIPDCLVKPLVEHLHRAYGHLSRHSIKQICQAKYWSRHLGSAIKDVVRDCFVCNLTMRQIKTDLGSGKARSFLPTKPRQMISIDLLTNLPTDAHGQETALVICDVFSKYLTVLPLKNKSSETISAALKTYFTCQQIPEVINSDAEVTLKAAVEELVEKYGVQHIPSTPYCHNQVHVERCIQDFKQLLLTNLYCPETGAQLSDWSDVAVSLCNCYNQTVVKGLNFSRAQLHYQNGDRTPFSYLQIAEANVDFTEQVLDRIKLMKAKDKSYEAVKLPSFHRGQLIFTRNESAKTTPPLKLRNKGPWKILNVDPVRKMLRALEIGTNKIAAIRYGDVVTEYSHPLTVAALSKDWDSRLHSRRSKPLDVETIKEMERLLEPSTYEDGSQEGYTQPEPVDPAPGLVEDHDGRRPQPIVADEPPVPPPRTRRRRDPAPVADRPSTRSQAKGLTTPEETQDSGKTTPVEIYTRNLRPRTLAKFSSVRLIEKTFQRDETDDDVTAEAATEDRPMRIRFDETVLVYVFERDETPLDDAELLDVDQDHSTPL